MSASGDRVSGSLARALLVALASLIVVSAFGDLNSPGATVALLTLWDNHVASLVIAALWAMAIVAATARTGDHCRRVGAQVAIALMVVNGVAAPLVLESWGALWRVPLWWLAALVVFEIASRPHRAGSRA